MKLNSYKKLTLVFVLLFVSLLSTLSPVVCSEEENKEINKTALEDLENLEYIRNEKNEIRGVIYNGKEEYIPGETWYPTWHIGLKKGEHGIDLTTANLRLALYEYDIEKGEKANTVKDTVGATKDEAGNTYFQIYMNINLDEKSKGYYLTLLELNEDGTTKKEHELDISIIGVKSAGRDQLLELFFKTQEQAQIDKEEEDKNTFFKLLEAIAETLTGLVDMIKAMLTDFVEILFKPSEDFMETWNKEMQEKVKENVPFMNLTTDILIKLKDNSYFYFDGGLDKAYLSWEKLNWNLKGNTYTIIQAGSFDFKDLIENTAYKEIRDYQLIFTNAGFCLLFANFIKKKLAQVFEK